MEQVFLIKAEDYRNIIRQIMQEEFQRVLKEDKDLNGSRAPEPYITRMQMAKDLNISLVTLRKYVLKGMPSRKLNGRVYFLRSEVDDYMEKVGKTKKG